MNKFCAVKSVNKCHQCGATSYKPVIKRDDQGVMRASGTYQCTGCRLVFETINEWRAGIGVQTVGENDPPRSIGITEVTTLTAPAT
jgi:hypothetical protein